MSRLPAGATALVLAALALGCLTRSPTVEFYTLGASEAAARRVTSDPEDSLAVGVGPVLLPRYLDRPQLALRSNESRILYQETRRWAGPLGGELLRVVGANLAAMLPSERVVVYPALPPFPLHYRVLIEIERFEADTDDRVTLHARWSILPGGGGSALSIGRVALVEQAASGSAADLVAGHTSAAAGLSRALAATLRSLAEAPEGDGPSRSADPPVPQP